MLNDPESYEFVELTEIDSTLFKDNIAYWKEEFKKKIDDAKYVAIDFNNSNNGVFRTYEVLDSVEVKQNLSKIEELNSIELNLGDKKNDVAYYTYVFKYRATNIYGAKVLSEKAVQVGSSPTFKVINIIDLDEENLLDKKNLFKPTFQNDYDADFYNFYRKFKI